MLGGCGRDGLDLGGDAGDKAVGQQQHVRLGQLGAGYLDGGLPLAFVPLGQDVEPLEERLVQAPFGRRVSVAVDLGDVLGQL
ncbi:MAG TPA: hypothetical protein VGI76_02860 [Solirubrobacteraceae bacterium]